MSAIADAFDVPPSIVGAYGPPVPDSVRWVKLLTSMAIAIGQAELDAEAQHQAVRKAAHLSVEVDDIDSRRVALELDLKESYGCVKPGPGDSFAASVKCFRYAIAFFEAALS